MGRGREGKGRGRPERVMTLATAACVGKGDGLSSFIPAAKGQPLLIVDSSRR